MEQDWFLYSITLFTFIVVFGMCYIRYKFTFFERNKVLSVSIPTFPFGNIYDVLFNNTSMFMQLWKFHNKVKRKKCKLGGFYVFLQPAIVVADAELAEILQHSEYFSDLEGVKRSNFNEEFVKKTLDNILKQFSNSWPSIISVIEHFANEEINLSQIMDNYVIVIAEQVFCAEESNRDFLQFIKQTLMLRNASYNFRKLAGIGYAQKFVAFNKRQIDFCKMLLTKSIEKRERFNLTKEDVLQACLENDCSISEINEHLLNFICDLNISTNLTLLALYELSLNIEIQEELRGEIARFRKTKTVSKGEDLNELSFLETVICETLRKYPPKPFICKVCTKNYEDKKLRAEKDLLLFVSTFGMHHDSQNYVNAELFDPDRFSEENQKFIDSKKYLPFGFRNKEDFDSRCVTVIMKLILIEILSNFKISLGKKSPKNLTFDETKFELKLKDDMWLKLDKI